VTSAWLLTLAPIAGLCADVIVQSACAHVLRRVGLSIVVGGLGGLAATAGILARVAFTVPAALDAAAAAMLVLTYLALAFGYWTFLNLNITSLRIRTLREILRGGEHGISRADLMARYSAQEFLRRRLERLELGGNLSCVDGRWRLASPKLLLLERSLARARALIIPAQREE